MSLSSLESASGYRPAMAFVCVLGVLGLVAARSTGVTLAGDHQQPARVVREALPPPDFDVVDRDGRTLALSVRQLDLVASPRALWQAHTPRRIAARLAAALGEPGAEQELLAELLPDADERGVIRVDARAMLLDEAARMRVELWARGRRPDGALARPPVRGITTEEIATGLWRIAWEPAVLLSEEQRRAQAGGDSTLVPLTWTRRIADELALCLWPDEALARSGDPELLEAQRARIWAALLPCAERVIRREIEGARAGDVQAALEEEGVASHQLRLVFRHERRYPIRHAFDGQDAFEIVGRWRFVDAETAMALACRELGLAGPQHCPDPLRPRLRRRAAELLDVRHPASGLERLAGELLARPEWSFLAAEPATYRYRRDRPVHRRARAYYFDETREGETPRVASTIDAELQAWTRHVLEETLGRSGGALAMAIVVELATADVLAVAAVSPYSIAEFLPTWHLFTPGSTFKTVVMATALDQGVVRSDESFFTHNGSFRLPGSGRRPIREAQGHPHGWVTAAEGLSRSVNAVMVQIGLRVPDRVFHRYLTELGYGRPPGVGIGVERVHPLPALPWKWDYEHASVSFGHEVGTSLWQHATGLATILSGGVARPLRLLREVRHEGRIYELPREEGRRVYTATTCRTVREMMELGATAGTGEPLWRRERQAGTPLVMGSKTGTSEKVPTEACLHNELWRNEENLERDRLGLPRVTYAEAMARPKPGHRTCYTSSICLFGRVEGTEREVMVLVVVDEPRAGGHFGSQVAGPAAMSLLKEALHLTRDGQGLLPAEPLSSFGPSPLEEQNDEDLPWAREVRAAW